MTSASRAFAAPERCDRPTGARASAAADQPGRFAHGPEEKHGFAGRTLGFFKAAMVEAMLRCKIGRGA